MKNIVLYHGGCADGFGAAFIAAMALRLIEDEIQAVSYGKPAPIDDCRGKNVYIVDFSYPAAELLQLVEVAESVVVLDHHKTAQAELEGLSATGLTIEFDMERSGARMAFDYFQKEAPWGSSDRGQLDKLSRYIQDRDLWQWKLTHSREVSAFIAAVPKELEEWRSNLLYRRWDSIVAAGDAILMATNSQVQLMTRDGAWREVDFEGRHGVAMINICGAAPGSEILNVLAKGRPFAVGWDQRGDGSYYFSLRSDDEGIDVGVFAAELKRRGIAHAGGGHARAAGFSSFLSPGEFLFR